MSNTPDITIQNLRKTYEVPEREPGLGAALKSLVSRWFWKRGLKNYSGASA